MQPPPFQLQSNPISTSHTNTNQFANNSLQTIQRHPDASNIVGNVSAGTNVRGGQLSDNSNRRLIERIADLEGRNAVQAGEEYNSMNFTYTLLDFRLINPTALDAMVNEEVTGMSQ